MLPDADGEGQLPIATNDLHHHVATNLGIEDEKRQMGRAGHALAVEADDEIPGPDPRLLGRAVGNDGPNEGRPRHDARAGGRILRLDPHKSTLDRSVADDLLAHPSGGVARDREADSLRAGLGDGGVDPHDAPMNVDERPAGVARIDRGVGLEEVAEGVADDAAAADGADDPVGQRSVEAVGIADRPHHLADLEGVAVPPRRTGEFGGVDADDGEIAFLVGPHEVGDKPAPIGESDFDPIGLVDDMVVGDDHAVGGDDHPRTDLGVGGAQGSAPPQAHALVNGEEEAARRRDIDHRRPDEPRQGREELADRGQLADRGGIADRGELTANLRVLDPLHHPGRRDQRHEDHEPQGKDRRLQDRRRGARGG